MSNKSALYLLGPKESTIKQKHAKHKNIWLHALFPQAF